MSYHPFQTSQRFLLLYGTRAQRTAVLHIEGAGVRNVPSDFFGVGIHLQICVPLENTQHVCPEMIGDSRTIVVGADEGAMHAFTWHGKVVVFPCILSLYIILLLYVCFWSSHGDSGVVSMQGL